MQDEIPTELDDPNVLDAGLLQVGTTQQAAEAAAEHGHVDVLRYRLTDQRRLDLCLPATSRA